MRWRRALTRSTVVSKGLWRKKRDWTNSRLEYCQMYPLLPLRMKVDSDIEIRTLEAFKELSRACSGPSKSGAPRDAWSGMFKVATYATNHFQLGLAFAFFRKICHLQVQSLTPSPSWLPLLNFTRRRTRENQPEGFIKCGEGTSVSRSHYYISPVSRNPFDRWLKYNLRSGKTNKSRRFLCIESVRY